MANANQILETPTLSLPVSECLQEILLDGGFNSLKLRECTDLF